MAGIAIQELCVRIHGVAADSEAPHISGSAL